MDYGGNRRTIRSWIAGKNKNWAASTEIEAARFTIEQNFVVRVKLFVFCPWNIRQVIQLNHGHFDVIIFDKHQHIDWVIDQISLDLHITIGKDKAFRNGIKA